ncbi:MULTISPECIES: ATP-binding protein [Halomonadaceae]|uniref:ATP-binding protein n=1 Tax=Halomonadaceae TaxID=28256 RepID=UPI0015814CBF|nr:MULTISPECIES: ATP-binding protein [Halomonas]MDI4639178.1 ATP-binding protein [Halomonas sp. BMC7]NUJ60168.1 AAA family ATPase [Halomonas taeanensis]
MDIYSEYVQLARLAVSGRQDDAKMFLQRTLRRAKKDRPDFEEQLKSLLSKLEKEGAPSTKRATTPAISSQSRISAQHVFTPDKFEGVRPIWDEKIENELSGVVLEREKVDELAKLGVGPTRTILFTGPPGVGKTMAANWLAHRIKKEIVVLDLAAVMSSYLGQTGNNLKKVVEEAGESGAILFLDEFDAIAKKRGDDGDIGELKRLVNVLLQSLDAWSKDGLLIAATNHPEMLDRAVWRRFDRVVEFDTPDAEHVFKLMNERVSASGAKINESLMKAASKSLEGQSYSDVNNWLSSVFRASVVSGTKVEEKFAERVSERLGALTAEERLKLACDLTSSGLSQRKAAVISGVSRDTIRKHL